MSEKVEVLYYVDENPEAVNRRAAQYFVDGIRSAVGARGKARIAISGGNTPKLTFELLATPASRTASKSPGTSWSCIGWTNARSRPISRTATTA